MPEGNTTRIFVLPADRQVPLPEALVGFVAVLAGGDLYRRILMWQWERSGSARGGRVGNKEREL